MSGWSETYRGGVAAWECDVFEHLTIAYYADRFADGAALVLRRLGEDPAAWRTTGLFARYQKELRAGDGLHVESAVVAAAGGRLHVGHRMLNSVSGELATLAEQVLEPVRPGGAVPAAAPAVADWESLAGAEAPPAAARAVPTHRDRIRPAELDEAGALALSGYVHRFSGACLQLIGRFGMSPEYMRANRRGFSTFETRLRIGDVASTAGRLVAVESSVIQIGGSSIRLLHRMGDGIGGAPIASFEQSGVQLDLDARRSAAWPEELRQAAQVLAAG